MKPMGEAFVLRGDALVREEIEAAMPFFDGGRHVISLVGGGGKTTLAHDLAARFAARGQKAVVMTTTRIGLPSRFCASIEDCRACWAAGEFAVCGTAQDGKFRQPKPALLAALLEEADAVLIEADGARRMPCKAPDTHEPVIMPETDVVVGVMGMDAHGKAIADICHRPHLVADLLGCDTSHVLTGEDMAAILLSESGTRKDVGARSYVIALNKCDDEARRMAGGEVLRTLKRRGHEEALLTCGMRRSETFEGM